MAEALVTWAEGVLRQYRYQIANMLGLDPTRKVEFRIDTTGAHVGNNPAVTEGTIVWLNPHKLKTNNPGAIVHEATHALMQGTIYGTGTKWLVEGIADYVRKDLGLADPGWQNTNRSNPKAGYEFSSAFLSYVERVKPGAVREITRALASGTYDPNSWTGYAGMPLQVYTKAYQTGLPARRLQAAANVVGSAIDVMNTTTNVVVDAFTNALGGTVYTDETTGGVLDGPGSGDGNNPRRQERREERREERQARRERQERKENRDQRSGYLNWLQQNQIALTPNLNSLVKQGFEKDWSMNTFLYYLRKTPEYRQSFPGIFNDDGTLRMSEAQYFANKKQYETVASTNGINLSEGTIGWLFKNEVDPTEFRDRAPAITQLRRNPELYKQFGQELIQGGIVKKGDVPTKKEMLRFVLGEAPKEWYDVWQDAQTRYAASEAGLALNKMGMYTSLRQGFIEKISGKGLTADEMERGFQEYARMALEVLPLSEARNFGLDKKDLQTIAFGGKGSAKAEQALKRVIATHEAFSEQRAAPQIYSSQEGGVSVLGGSDTKKQRGGY